MMRVGFDDLQIRNGKQSPGGGKLLFIFDFSVLNLPIPHSKILLKIHVFLTL